MLALLLAAAAHYDVQLTIDIAAKRIAGAETMAGVRREYTVTAAPGLRWLDGGAGMFTAFNCEAWMTCDAKPDHRATLRLEIVAPAGFTAAGPGELRKQWRDAAGEHFLFEQRAPVQTFLFSFGVARMKPSQQGRFAVFAPDAGHRDALAKTADAYAFFRRKASVDPLHRRYTQVFLPMPGSGPGQEAAGHALMGAGYLASLESKDDRNLMAHELAHQWWAVLVGIRSWSDFWLNEGMAEFMTIAYAEHHRGRAAYEEELARLRKRLEEIRARGGDRPLHWEQWKTAEEALGPLPYVKGALFLDRLRRELGERDFWRGIALYTRRHAGGLVDSRDFQRAMEEAARRPLAALFDEGVYR